MHLTWDAHTGSEIAESISSMPRRVQTRDRKQATRKYHDWRLDMYRIRPARELLIREQWLTLELRSAEFPQLEILRYSKRYEHCQSRSSEFGKNPGSEIFRDDTGFFVKLIVAPGANAGPDGSRDLHYSPCVRFRQACSCRRVEELVRGSIPTASAVSSKRSSLVSGIRLGKSPARSAKGCRGELRS